MKKLFFIPIFLFLVACNISQINLPESIHEQQIIRTLDIDENSYALVAKRNMNYPLFDVPMDFETTFSGVLVRDENIWKPMVEIFNRGSINNPLNFWKENTTWYFTVADASGAGSGEGYAKLFSSEDTASWKLLHCWYHVPEGEMVSSIQQARVEESTDRIIQTNGRFEQLVADKEGIRQTIPLPECSNAEVRYTP